MDFSEPAEYYDLRDAIGAITGKYGCTYFAEPAAAGAPTTDLWQDLAHAFLLCQAAASWQAFGRVWWSAWRW
jgi:hypothetical protein